MQEGVPNSTGLCSLAHEWKIIKVLDNKKNNINLTFSGNGNINRCIFTSIIGVGYIDSGLSSSAIDTHTLHFCFKMSLWEIWRGSFWIYFTEFLSQKTLKFCHTYARTESFKYTVFNRFPAYFDQLSQDLRDQLLFSISGFFNEHKETLQKS